MALDEKTFLEVSSHFTEGNSIYTYRTADLIVTVVASGYFNDVYDRLRVGDWIQVASGVGGVPAFNIINVATITADVVTVVTTV